MNKLLNDKSLTEAQKAFVRKNSRKTIPNLWDILFCALLVFAGISNAWLGFLRDSFSLPVRNLIVFSVAISILYEIVMAIIFCLGWGMAYMIGTVIAQDESTIDFFKTVICMWDVSLFRGTILKINRVAVVLTIIGLAAGGHWFFASLQLAVWGLWELTFCIWLSQCKTAFKNFNPEEKVAE